MILNPTPDQFKKYFEYSEESKRRRGDFLTIVSHFETAIDEYLSNFFCSDTLKNSVILFKVFRKCIVLSEK